MISIDKYEYFYVQGENSIIRTSDKEKNKRKIQDKLKHFDNLIEKSKKNGFAKEDKRKLSNICNKFFTSNGK